MHVPTTQPSLLLRIREPEDRAAWHDFSELYSRIIFRFAQQQGLSAQDAEEVMQDVLCSVARSIRAFEYNPSRGQFRAWLFRITRRRITDRLRRNYRSKETSGNEVTQAQLDQCPAPDNEEAEAQQFEMETQRQLFQWAAEKVRPLYSERTWDAFWRTAVQNEKPEAVAESVGLSRAGVYVAKYRVIRKIRDLITETEAE